MKNNKSIRSAAAIFAGLIVLYPAQYVRTASGQTSTQETNPTPFANSASLNNAYFKKGCHVCHSNVGQGARSGKRLVDPLLPAEDFYAFVRRPYGVMPPYSPKVLSDRDLDEIYQYLESLESPKVDDIPQLQQLMREGN